MSELTPELIALTEQLFKEFTEILIKHNVTANQADYLTMCFNSRWHCLPLSALSPLKDVLQKISLAKYFEKEAEIKKLFDQALVDLRSLLKSGAGEINQTA